MTLLYLFGFFRTVFIIVGVVFVLRLIGRLMVAKRNLNEQNNHQKNVQDSQKLKDNSRTNFGRTTISKIRKDKLKDDDFVDYEEVD